MSPEEINAEFYELELRFNHLCFLGAALVAEYAVPDVLDDLFSNEGYEELMFLGLPREAEEEEWGKDEIADWLISTRIFGWICQAATPVRDYFDEHSYGSSWGYYSTKWIYADDFDALVQKAKDWANERAESDKAKLLKKGVLA